jgi:hypothetical protein
MQVDWRVDPLRQCILDSYWFQKFGRRWCNTVNVELTHALEGIMSQAFVILKSGILRCWRFDAIRS